MYICEETESRKRFDSILTSCCSARSAFHRGDINILVPCLVSDNNSLQMSIHLQMSLHRSITTLLSHQAPRQIGISLTSFLSPSRLKPLLFSFLFQDSLLLRYIIIQPDFSLLIVASMLLLLNRNSRDQTGKSDGNAISETTQESSAIDTGPVLV